MDIEDNTGVSSDFISSLESRPWGIEIPAPTDAAERAARWMKDPMEMLVDLTDGLNIVLCDCHLQFYDTTRGPRTAFYLAYGSKKSGGEKIRVFVLLTELCRTAIIRNTIEQTPFNPQTIRELYLILLGPVDERLKQENVLSKLVDTYQDELEVLADWIEAKKILAGKHTPATPDETLDCPDSEISTATFDDVREAYRQIQQQGQWPTKERVGDLLRQHKTISTNVLCRWLRVIRNER